MVKSNKEKIPQVAVIGCGHWGKNLVRNYHNLGALKLICDKNETALTDFKSQYDDVDTCIALAETHFSIARESLLAGKNVFVEKPLTLHAEEGRELIELAKEKNKVLMVGHLLQYHPVFMCLKEMVSSGELGRINYIYS
jgi:UDP-2-acetamido-3-amino-2,3-dideoxy-glucuronate N-acetyltransferase